MKQPKVSVCVPVYKGEPYIEKCVRSLFSQTLDNIEYIFVNDNTPDKSMEIIYKVLNEYPYRKPFVKIINHEKNQGIAISNKDGLLATSGEYVITCDNDDWINQDMYERLYERAKKTDADVVCCDYYKERNNKTISAISHFEGTKDARIRAWIRREYAAYSWATMVRGDIYRYKVHYITEGYAEDCVRACQVQFLADRYEYINSPMYHYRYGGLSSSNMRLRMNADIIAYQWIFDFLRNNDAVGFEKDINVTKLRLKSDWCSMELLPEFYTIWPEVNKLSLLWKTNLSLKKQIVLSLAICKMGILYNAIVNLYQCLRKCKVKR